MSRIERPSRKVPVLAEIETELPLDAAHDFLQGFAASPLVCQEEGYAPRVWENHGFDSDQRMRCLLWAPDQAGTGGSWVEAEVTAYTDQGHDGNDEQHEGLTVEVGVPVPGLDPRVYPFVVELTDFWVNWVARYAKKHRRPLSTDMHTKAGGLWDSGGAYLVGRSNEPPGDLTIQVEEVWWEGGYDAEPRDRLSREAYGQQVAERLSALVCTVPEAVGVFTTQKIPKLEAARENRIRTKPPGWIRAALAQLGAKRLEAWWQAPEEGTEPHEFAACGILPVDEAGYEVFMICVDHEGEDHSWPGRFDAEFLFPDQAERLFLEAPDRQEVFDRLRAFMNTQQIPPAFGDSGSIAFRIGARCFRFGVFTGDSAENPTRIGWSVTVDETSLRLFFREGVTREAILAEYVAFVHRLHPHLMEFVREQSYPQRRLQRT